MSQLPPIPPASDRVLDWMERKRRSLVATRLRAQLEGARRRRSKRALVALADLDLLLTEMERR